MAAVRRVLWALLLALSAPVAAAPPAPVWTRAWAASLWEAKPEQRVEVDNATLRMVLRVRAGGPRLRLRLANDYGDTVAVGAASVRLPGSRAVPVTVGGNSVFAVRGGAPLVSDPIVLPVQAFDLIEVSLYLPDRQQLGSVHEAAAEPARISPPGDFTAVEFAPATTNALRPLLAGVDVETAASRPVVVAFGDSITDNGSCPEAAQPRCRWGEVLGRRFAAAGMPQVVIDQAISGNRVISDGTGPSALARLDRDVLVIPGVTHMVLLEGINDVGNSGLTRNGYTRPEITAQELIEGYRQLVLRAREHGIKVVAMTILPFEGAFYYSPEREAIRREVNSWIRSAGVFDAVIDMARVVADPADPDRLSPALQGGDNLHPDGRGETAIAEAIDLDLFR